MNESVAVTNQFNSIQSISLDYAPVDETGCPIPVPEKRNSITVSAKVFIDCSYEGDVLGMSGAQLHLGPRVTRALRRIACRGAPEPLGPRHRPLHRARQTWEWVAPIRSGSQDRSSWAVLTRLDDGLLLPAYEFDGSGQGHPDPRADEL